MSVNDKIQDLENRITFLDMDKNELKKETKEQQSQIDELKRACRCAANTLEALGEEDGFTGSQLQIDKLRKLAKK